MPSFGTQTFYVTYSDPKSGTPTTSLGPRDPGNPRCFKIEVIVTPEMHYEQVRSLVFAQADQKYREYIRATFAPPAPAISSSPPEIVKEEEVEYVFKPSEIGPFIEEGLVRWGLAAGMPIRLELSGHGTASTDCLGKVTINPDPLLRGHISDFFGRGDHESGHIRDDREGTAKDRPRRFSDPAFGTALLGRANEEGGEVLQHILNIIMDRRVDYLGTLDRPGNALDIWSRLGNLLPGERELADGGIQTRRSGTALDCDKSVFTDFIYACKKHTKARHACVRKAVAIADKACKRVNAGTHKYSTLLKAAKRVLSILRANATELDKQREADREQARQEERAFIEFMRALIKRELGQNASLGSYKAFRQIMAQRNVRGRQRALSNLSGSFKMASGTGSLPAPPPPVPATGPSGEDGKLVRVSPDAAAYAAVLPGARPHVVSLRKALLEMSVPQHQVVRGLTEGEFDIGAIAALVTGRPDCMKVDLRKILLDLAISFVLDVSGSMNGEPVRMGRELGVGFNEAIRSVPQCVDGWLYAFDHDIYDCGKACPSNGIAKRLGGGWTNEALALRYAAQPLGKSSRRRKVIVMACDGGPSDLKACENEVKVLMRAGILPIRVLIGVDYSPGTYPVELFFESWHDFCKNFAQTFATIFKMSRL